MANINLISRLPLTDFERSYLEYWSVLPLGIEEGRLEVAVAGSPDPIVLTDLAETFGGEVEIVTTDEVSLSDGIRRSFAQGESMDHLVRTLSDDGSISDVDLMAGSDRDARDLANQPPVVRFVNLMFREAHEARASDIHLEATAVGLDVRFRIDGVLSTAASPPSALQAAVISRVKLIADLDIAERRAPQDGRVRVRLEERDLDLRVSTLPTLFGESVVVRLLDQGGGPTSLAELGMTEGVRRTFRTLAERPNGIVISTGPTGSGKTTTLYAALRLRDVSSEKVITVEDPIEYQLSGVTQVPVNRRAGMSFAASLRSILRQDPDVVMVGEMRDEETSSIAVQAAMTGHVVFSTLHTNDAASAVARLVDLGVEPYLIAATLEGVLAQRLVRRLCGQCAEEYVADPASVAAIADVYTEGTRLRRARGCDACRGTGFVGRIGIFELLVISDEIRDLISSAPDQHRIREAASSAGQESLRQDGWRKVRAGLTTLEEVARVVQA